MNKCIDTQLGHSNTTRVPDIARLHSKFHRISKSLTVRPEGSHTQPQKSGCANPDGAGQHGNRKHHQRESESLPNCSETRPKPVSCPKSCTNKGPSRFRTVLEEGSTLPGTVLERRRLNLWPSRFRTVLEEGSTLPGTMLEEGSTLPGTVFERSKAQPLSERCSRRGSTLPGVVFENRGVRKESNPLRTLLEKGSTLPGTLFENGSTPS